MEPKAKIVTRAGKRFGRGRDRGDPGWGDGHASFFGSVKDCPPEDQEGIFFVSRKDKNGNALPLRTRLAKVASNAKRSERWSSKREQRREARADRPGGDGGKSRGGRGSGNGDGKNRDGKNGNGGGKNGNGGGKNGNGGGKGKR